MVQKNLCAWMVANNEPKNCLLLVQCGEEMATKLVHSPIAALIQCRAGSSCYGGRNPFRASC
jgi:hypothetical protein